MLIIYVTYILCLSPLESSKLETYIPDKTDCSTVLIVVLFFGGVGGAIARPYFQFLYKYVSNSNPVNLHQDCLVASMNAEASIYSTRELILGLYGVSWRSSG